MKKVYEKPILEEEKIEIEDICAASLGGLPGDVEQNWTWGN